MNKKCSKCGQTKDESEYYRLSTGGTFAECKDCNRQRAKVRYDKDPKHIQEINNTWKNKLSPDELIEFQRKVKENKKAKGKESL